MFRGGPHEHASGGGRSASAGSSRLASALAVEADRRLHFTVACDRRRRRGGGGHSRCLDLNAAKASRGSDTSIRPDADNGALKSLGAVCVAVDIDHGAAQSLWSNADEVKLLAAAAASRASFCAVHWGVSPPRTTTACITYQPECGVPSTSCPFRRMTQMPKELTRATATSSE
jgi:hypothetical protein